VRAGPVDNASKAFAPLGRVRLGDAMAAAPRYRAIVTIELDPAAARRARWTAHRLGGSDLAPAEVVARAVALQGQDLPAVLRAIAIRSRPGTTLDDVRAAFDAGELVRSWPMRGTLFATTPHRLAELLALTAERTHRSTTLRRARLGLDEAAIAGARAALEVALEAGPLRRAEALDAFERAGISTAAGRGYHLIMHLAVAGVAHWGPFAEGGEEQLLVRSPAHAAVDAEAALVGIVGDVVASRGPVTDADVAWWTGLPASAVRRAAGAVDSLVPVRIGGPTERGGGAAWVIGEPAVHAESTGVVLIPGFDEWILGYADRSLVASPAAFAALVPGGNAVFRPAVLVDGVVVGSWRLPARRSARSAGAPELELVEPVSARTRAAIDRALDRWPHG